MVTEEDYLETKASFLKQKQKQIEMERIVEVNQDFLTPRLEREQAKEELMHAYKRVLDSKVLVSMMDGSRLVGSAARASGPGSVAHHFSSGPGSVAHHFSSGPGSVSPEWIARRKLGPALSAQRPLKVVAPAANDDEAYDGGGTQRRIASRSPQRSLDFYWINLDESFERRASMERMFESAAASFPTVRSTRVTGIDTEAVRDMLRRGRVKLKEGLATAPPGAEEETWRLNFRNEYTEGQFACALSHLTAIKRAYDDNSELALILEDDVSVPASFLETWESYVAMAPPDWTVLQWYTNNAVVMNASFHNQDPWISWLPGHWGTQAYMVNRDGMERILRGMQGDASADWYFGDDIVVADELLYALAGRTYTATRTLGI
ncbi:hypothetical protein A3770_17p78920 [Chloropicon primus]|uniref:Glycosyl transferase family 25 domain-containing protein n=1 Tax=Chloropicon primus TaxID=1764295 RepID=A0A5B8N0S3_9CHLO|nr:hypothetical protein A3770_17p78920 [Chloropicon primus]|eukprot:QDZ25374.1 hypothetical protein A3770_17p78920 [Chloropicon primus]